MTLFYIIAFLVTGLFAGFFSGLIGIGGGVVVVPSLYFLFKKLQLEHSIQMAIATSLSIMIFTTSSSTLFHGLKKKIFWKYLLFLIIGASTGAVLGPYFNQFIPALGLKIFFAILELLIAVKLFFHKPREETDQRGKHPEKKWFLFICLGFLVGLISSMLGLGGGVILVPSLIALGLNAKKSVGTAAAYSLCLAIIGSLSYLIFSKNSANPFGLINIKATICVASASLIAAPIGAHFCHKIKESSLKKIFALFLVVVAILIFV